MKSIQKGFLIALMLSAIPSTLYADQLDGLVVLVPFALLINGLASLIILGCVRGSFRKGKVGRTIKFLFGLAGAFWCTMIIRSLLKDWPEEIIDQSTANYYVEYTHTTKYAYLYFTGMALNAASVILGIYMVSVVLRPIFKRKP